MSRNAKPQNIKQRGRTKSIRPTLPSAVQKDKILHEAIKEFGPLELRTRRSAFASLLRAITHQQVSSAAARSIEKKFFKAVGSKSPKPEHVLATSKEALRSAGLSGQKVTYVRDLAQAFVSGAVKPRTFKNKTNEVIVSELVTVKGIGVWTVHMFLLFTLGREDVLPTLDLGIKKGFQIVYRLAALPTHDDMERIATPWRSHASLVSRYLWKVADKAKRGA